MTIAGDLLEHYVDTRLDQTETLFLTIPANSDKSYLLAPDLELETNGRRFYIDELEQLRAGTAATVTVEAHALWYRLADEAQPGAVTLTDATPAEGLATILAGSAWSIGTGSSAATATYNLEAEDRSTLQLLRRWAKITARYLRFDTVNHLVDIIDTRGRDLGLAFRYRRNVDTIRRRARAPEVTRLYPYGKNDLGIAGINGGVPWLEDLTYYTDQGMSTDDARTLYTRSRLWSDTSYVTDTELLAAAQARLATLAQPVVTYELDVFDIDELTGVDSPLEVGDIVRVTDPDFGDDLRATVVRYVEHPLEPWRNVVELAFLVDPLIDDSETDARSVSGADWQAFAGPARSPYQIRNDGNYTVARVPLRFSAGGVAHHHLDLELTGVGAGTANVEVYDAEAATTVFRTLELDYVDAGLVTARLSWLTTDLLGAVDYRIRVTTVADGGPHPSAGVDVTADTEGEAMFYVLAQQAVSETPTADNSQTFNVTGAVQQFTVPDNVTEVTLDVAGAGGGEGNANATTFGGRGTRVVVTMPVTPGEVLDLYVGQSGRDGDNNRAGGWPNGGNGGNKASSGNLGGGGGGSSDVRRVGGAFVDAIVVAPGGGGGAADPYAGGDAGFYEGADGVGTSVEIFGTGAGAQGATQTAGGAGEDLAGNGTDGDAGTFNAGANGKDVSAFRDPGGGGGGGRYGGGAGGSPDPTLDAAGGGGGGSGWLDLTAGLYDILIEDAYTPGGEGPGDGRIIVTWSDPV